jgi:anti-anti-sigma factor
MSTFDDVAVVHLSGEVSHAEILELEKILGKLANSSKVKVVLNFKNVEHVNYKTIHLLLERATRLRSLNGDLKFASLSHYTRNILRFTGADQIVEAYDSVYDAILSFNGAEEEHRIWH